MEDVYAWNVVYNRAKEIIDLVNSVQDVFADIMGEDDPVVVFSDDSAEGPLANLLLRYMREDGTL